MKRCRQVHCSMLLRLTTLPQQIRPFHSIQIIQGESVYFRQKGDIFDIDGFPSPAKWVDSFNLSLSLSRNFSSGRATQDVTEDDRRIRPIKRGFVARSGALIVFSASQGKEESGGTLLVFFTRRLPLSMDIEIPPRDETNDSSP